MTYKEPFIDPRVRMAVSHAIDRESHRPGAHGHHRRALVPDARPSGERLHSRLRRDERAEVQSREGKASCLPRPRPTAIRSRPSSTSSPGPTCSRAGDEVVQAIGQNLSEVGFKFQHSEHGIRAPGSNTSAQPFPPEQRATLQMISHDNTSGDASFSFPRYITCKGVVSATCNPKIDELAHAGRTWPKARSARDLYREVARILYLEESSMIGVAEQARLIMLGPDSRVHAEPAVGHRDPHRGHHGSPARLAMEDSTVLRWSARSVAAAGTSTDRESSQ